jgi:hypothetical protein
MSEHTLDDPFAGAGRQEGTFDAIRNAATDIMWIPPPYNRITKYELTYNADKMVETLKAYQGETLLFTLTFTYNSDKKIISVARN